MSLAALDLPRVPPGVVSHVEEDWLLFTAALADESAAPVDHARLLAWNAALAGAAKFTLRPDLRMQLHAEIPAAGPHHPNHAVLVEATAEGLAIAQFLWREATTAATLRPPPALAPAADLLRACTESGWDAKPAGAEELALLVELPGDGIRRHARVSSRADGSTLIASELVVVPHASPETRRALAQFLLLTGALLRWARPVMSPPAEAACSAGFQIIVPGAPAPDELGDALCILAVAGELWAEEAAALADVDLARDYLAATATDPFPPVTTNL